MTYKLIRNIELALTPTVYLNFNDITQQTQPKAAHRLAYLIGQFQPIWSVQTKSLKYLPVCGLLQIKSGTSDRSFWSSIMLEFLTHQQILSLSMWPAAGEMWQIQVTIALWIQISLPTQFIEIYRTHTCLWQVKTKVYSNRVKKDGAYKSLVDFRQAVNPDCNLDLWRRK